MDCDVLTRTDSSPVLVRIDALHPADSPRLKGISAEHARLIADAAVSVPPILVQQGTMRVIDGMHRIRAAQLQGKQHVDVYLCPAGTVRPSWRAHRPARVRRRAPMRPAWLVRPW